MRRTVFESKAAVLRLLETATDQIATADTAADVIKHRLVCAAIKTIGAARWARGWETA
jgi:hypothetical protein